MNPLMKYLLSSVTRRPEGEGEGAPAAPAEPDTGEAAFKFDPSTFFVPPASEGSGADEGNGDGKAGEPEPSPKDPASSAASTEAGSTPSSPTPEPAKEGGEDPLAALRASVQAFLTKPATAPAEASQPKQPEAPAAPKDTTKPEAGAKYAFDVPAEIVDALGAEEPSTRRKAVNGLMTGLANRLAEDFGKAMAAMAQHVQQETLNAVMTHINTQQTVEGVRRDFYDAHKDLKQLVDNLPALDGVIWQVAKQIADATGKKGYDAEVREQTAATIKLQLGLVKPGAPPAPAAAGTGGRQPRPGQFSAGGSSGGRPNGAADTNEFASVLTIPGS